MRNRKSLLFIIACAGVTGCAGSSPPAVSTPIPLEELWASPVVRQPRLSPDGLNVAWIADHEGTPNVWMAPTDSVRGRPTTSPAGGRRLTSRAEGVRSFVWSSDGRFILYSTDQSGDMRFAIFRVDPDSGEERPLAEFEGTQVFILATSPQEPERVLVAMNRREPTRFDV